MHVVVATVVHHPLDGRILHRQIAALLARGHRVTYLAPWTSTASAVAEGVEAVDVPRARGRRRIGPIRAARRLLRDACRSADLVIVHDPDLLAALVGWRRPPTVWDVHEDTAAALADRAWMPRPLRTVGAAAVRIAERVAERRVHLLLAEDGYGSRFRRAHPVVPNEPWVPASVRAPGDARVVHLGRLSTGRGLETLLALPDALGPAPRLELIGPADVDVAERVAAAEGAGRLRWYGFVRNDEALALVDGALCGLALLRDLPNYCHSRPTKVVEYMARGVPVVTTPNPIAREIVEEHGCGIVVPFDDPDAVVAAVDRLRSDPDERRAMGLRGHHAARAHFDWHRSGERFVDVLEAWARPGG